MFASVRYVTFLQVPYLFKYKSYFFVPKNQSKNGWATYTRGYVELSAKITTFIVYTEGFRVPELNRRVKGCKSINLYPVV